ncbi:MAG: hypothetical protein AAFX94_09835 [Myxococcota bacterium]
MPRVTCLKCGSQYDVGYDTSTIPVNCECGPSITYPEVHYSGVQPSERAAERLRYRAFHSAGLVKNFGIIALTVSAVSVLFFPLALVGIGIGIYTLAAMRGPLSKYVGREQAIAAIVLGVLVFGIESAVALDWLEQRRISRINAVQASVRDDLRRLFRTQRLFRAAQDRYGRFDDFPGRFQAGAYTLYLSFEDVLPAERNSTQVTDPHQGPPVPSVTPHAFTAVAVANLDGDADLDVWTLNDAGDIVHHRNDNDYLQGFRPPEPPRPASTQVDREPVIAQQEPVEAESPPTPTPVKIDEPPAPRSPPKPLKSEAEKVRAPSEPETPASKAPKAPKPVKAKEQPEPETESETGSDAESGSESDAPEPEPEPPAGAVPVESGAAPDAVGDPVPEVGGGADETEIDSEAGDSL